MLGLVQKRRAKSNPYGTYLDSSLNLSLLTLPSCQEWATMRSITITPPILPGTNSHASTQDKLISGFLSTMHNFMLPIFPHNILLHPAVSNTHFWKMI